MTRWIDISQRLDDQVAMWPGDTPFSYQLNWKKQDSGSVNVGQITMSTHAGTHIDAPFHFDEEGKRVLELDLDLYIGRARVIHLPNTRQMGIREMRGMDIAGVERLLIYTGAWRNRQVFPETIPHVEAEAADYLAEKGVRLLGVDLPSVDQLDSKTLPAHHALARHGIHILEGIVLDGIAPGDYELAALPLPLAEADGSPVRAALRKISEE
ncbi:arylformamidase [Aneurinibacillus sp. REN35]|uniref:arylformamidase n=1 Tax=Aneurinibacillus sp. REN35 TaxID=3237286 RepID=UPI0035294047